ncbi:MAG TPA: type II toxin-antitoxin system PemK/MazF family toxin [Pirellulales bacterium]|jgi:mRNA-degrading endonuclease toxin of MazEF toxin-antitoxin module|nr:type II toxin-antitoxin system PemK/MazF family toxin [Pirellulales bacterium]
MIVPGEVYAADFPEAGRHPVIVLSRENLNRGSYALVVVCTSSRFTLRKSLPNCVPFQAGQFGLTVDCVAQCENILSIASHLDLEAGPIGNLDAEAMRSIVKAVGHVIESDCEPV